MTPNGTKLNRIIKFEENENFKMDGFVYLNKK